MRLFCFPYAGGGASLFRHFPNQLPPEVETCPVQLPGRENRLGELPFSDINALLPALSQALLPYLDKPYAFFGHSMGALISFELARALRRQENVPGPVHIFVSGHRAPQLPDPTPPVHHLPDEQFLDALRRLNGTSEAVLKNSELLQLLLPLLRADFSICDTYEYTQEAPLNCPITAFGGIEDEEAPCESIQAWRDQTSFTFRTRFFAGGHFYFLEEERETFLQALSQELLNDLRRG